MSLSIFNSIADQVVHTIRERLAHTLNEVIEKPHSPEVSSAESVEPFDFPSQTFGQLKKPSDGGNLASKIDHTLLKPDTTREDIVKICQEALEHRFASVCINSTHLKLAVELLKGSKTKPIVVVGFPFGAIGASAKGFEAKEAVRLGAQEIDMVINIGALKDKDYALVLSDIRGVVEASRPFPVKVILETSGLDHEQKIIGCVLAQAAGAAFVKTSTGFGAGGATPEDVQLMKRTVGPSMRVKASGGIRTYEDAMRMIEAGADRIGASSSVAIVTHVNAANDQPSLAKNHDKESQY